MAEFEVPAFLENRDVDTIHAEMLAELPEDIDRTEGGFLWDFTRPTALIASELLQFYAVEILKLIFPQTSSGEYLDMLAQMVQVTRKEASHAAAVLTVTGTPGTVIPTGTVFCTEAVADVASIEFATLASAGIPAGGTASITVQAVEPGTGSNVDAGTIILMSSPIKGVATVTNAAAATGGTEEEDDDSLRERVLSATQVSEASFIGNMYDFKRWAESVTGMGTAIVMLNWNGPETVKIVCVDANGEPANQTILDAVYNLIMSPNAPLDRLAPPNTTLTVAAPTGVSISFAFSVILADGYNASAVEADFRSRLDEYYKGVSESGAVRYTKVSQLLSETVGVVDFTGLTINSGTSNIPIDEDEYPYTSTVTITSISEE